MRCNLNKCFYLAFVSIMMVIFCLSESGFTNSPPPPQYYLNCVDFTYQHGQWNFIIIPCGTSMANCSCPPGYSMMSYNHNKIIHRKSPSRPLHIPASGKAKRLLTPNAEAEPTYSFTHTLQGEWEDVAGYVGFQYTDKNTKKDYIACLIGLYVESIGNGEYKSEPWDKKIFWIEVGDGAPMHVCAIYAPNYEEDGVEYDNVYWAPNFMYLPPGVQDKSQARNCELWMYLDEDDEIEEVWVDIYDKNWELSQTKQLGIGDQIQAFTPLIDPSEPASFLGISLEDRFRTVKTPPVFLYEHMTPNVDFENEMSKGFDFDDADLQYILYGESTDDNDVLQYSYSTFKNVNLKWGNAKPAKVQNWWQHEMSALMNFFLPK